MFQFRHGFQLSHGDDAMDGRFETGKDTIQVLLESASEHAGKIAEILSVAFKGVTHEVGDWMAEGLDTYQRAQRSKSGDHDHDHDAGAQPKS